MRMFRASRPILVVATTALLAALVSTGPANASTVDYVALGDSYSAGSGVPTTSTDISPLCLQSNVNYPKLVASDLGLQLADVTCGAATTSNMTVAQYPGVPPQFDALSADTSVVTIGIGGNDNNLFISAVIECGLIDILNAGNQAGNPCEQQFGAGLESSLAADAPTIAAALRQIHQLAPGAKVFMAGYPDIFPQSGNCFTAMPITVGDAAFLNRLEQDLNAMLRSQAEATGVTFVDTFTPSLGHDSCQAADVRWIEPFIGANGALFVHPNASGEAADARDMEAAMHTAGIG
jgi:hypothetical protein